MAQTILNRLLLILFARFAHAKSEFVSNPVLLQNQKHPHRDAFDFGAGNRI